jgi:hypothetical protein
VLLVNPGAQFNSDDDEVLLSLAASDSDSGDISYSAIGLPAGLELDDESGLIEGEISSSADTSSPYNVVVTATDGSATATQTFSWYVAPAPAISIIDSGTQKNLTGDYVITPITAVDPFGGAASFSESNLPAGLTINPTTGLITGTVGSDAEDDSPYTVTITATDGGSHSATDTFTWTVSAPSLQFADPGPQTSPVGLPVDFTFKASESATWSDESGDEDTLPAGLSLADDGVLTGTPTTAGNYLVVITATSGSVDVTRSFEWQVTAAGVAFPGNQTGTEGQTVSLQLQGVGGAGLTYTAAGLPAGLSLNIETGLISGTIASATAGIYEVDVAAIAGSNIGSQSFTWIVNPAISVTAVNDQTSTEGQAVSIQVQASESDATLTYTAWGLPTGVTISSSTGLISGTVASGDALQGDYLVTVQVSDGTNKNSVSFAWLVNPASTPSAPVEEKVPNQTSTAGESVFLSLDTFDEAGFGYLVDVSNLPDGLVFNAVDGAIEGVVADDAVSPVPYNVKVTVDDGLGNKVTEKFQWSVDPASVTAQAYPITATEGVDTGTITIGSFTTPDRSAAAGDFLVTVKWGDGQSDLATVEGGFGSFTIVDDHVFADQGELPVSITIDNIYGATKETIVYGTANVTSSLLGGFQLGALSGTSTPLTLAYFNVGTATPGDFTATINWGDGSEDTEVDLTTASNGLFAVTGSHSYSVIGQYTATITVSDEYGNSQSVTSTVEVGNLYAGVQGTMTLASFTGVSGASYSVSINWGDGDTDSGTATNVGGVVTITASHTFAVDSIDNSGGVYQVQVTVTGAGTTLNTTVPVEVTRPPLFMVVANVPATAGTVLTNQVVALFVEPDAADGEAEFDASISWGDGTSGTGSVEEVANGLFEVQGTYTYSKAPIGGIGMTVSQGWQVKVNVAEEYAKSEKTLNGLQEQLNKLTTELRYTNQVLASLITHRVTNKNSQEEEFEIKYGKQSLALQKQIADLMPAYEAARKEDTNNRSARAEEFKRKSGNSKGGGDLLIAIVADLQGLGGIRAN